MARVSTYLNFPRSTEEAFRFYQSIFGGELASPILRLSEVPSQPGQPPISEADKDLVMHIELQILGGHMLMGTDAPESLGFKHVQGNNVHIHLEPDSLSETKRLFAALSEGGKVDMPLVKMFWGAYYGSLVDRYGIPWMFNYRGKE